MHRPYGLQGSLKRRYKHPSPTSINGYHTAKKLLSQSPAKRPTFAFTGESGYTTRLSEKDRTQRHTRRKRGRFGWGAIITLGAFHTFRKPCVARCQNGKLCPFWVLVGRSSRRTQRACGTAMRLCASLFQGVAAPLGYVIFFRFCRNYGFHTLCSGLSACARHRRYHYPRRALRASVTLDSRLSKRLSCYSFRPS